MMVVQNMSYASIMTRKLKMEKLEFPQLKLHWMWTTLLLIPSALIGTPLAPVVRAMPLQFNSYAIGNNDEMDVNSVDILDRSDQFTQALPVGTAKWVPRFAGD